ncbi:L-threonylcarbamoyladenylate synthase [Balneolales bacterium ANBcel1]|nr:L-threonylcarbamoyladenylate synthase [Balneolales bacterium ANBcel1]
MIDTTPAISLSHYAELLRKGGVVAFPTETVYGLGADAWNADAIARIFALKGRPPDNPLIVHVGSVEMAETLAAGITEDARLLMEHFWPGPLTLIFPKRPEVLDIVTAGIATVAVRMPDHPIPLRLIGESGPLAAPSANTSGRPSPTRAEHVRHDFGDEVPVIEGGSCQYGLESTVLDLSQHPYTVLRPGHVTQSDLERVLKQPVRMAQHRSDDDTGVAPRSPGMKYTHYAPDARVRWMTPDELDDPPTGKSKTLYLLHTLREHQAVPTQDTDSAYAGDSGGTGDSGGLEADSRDSGSTGDARVPGGSGFSDGPGVSDDPGDSGFSDSTDDPGDSGDAKKRARQPLSVVHYREDYIEMARDLYDRFRMADLNGYEEIAIEPFPAWHEMTEALLNRIRKAIGD